MDGFTIVPSTTADETHPAIPPDLATCPDCLRELHDPSDRRYRFAIRRKEEGEGVKAAA